LVLEFIFHRITVFMMDDLWYSTNLATGETLKNVADVFEGQVWHYLNWGGRSITHTLLQFILMGGELFADILNSFVTIFLAFICCLFVKKEFRAYFFALTSSLLIAFNPNIQYSMFWQSGSVNYLYSTCWILVFMLIYLRPVADETKLTLPGINYWIVPLALITGWSNENMGPASFCLAFMCVIYLRKSKKIHPKAWMLEGMLFSLLGSALCILAPGNFVRSEFVTENTWFDVIRDRSMSMLTGGCSFLLPSFLLLLFLMVISRFYCGQKATPEETILLITAFLAYGAMILSPHFPDRAAFGIMVINIILSGKYMVKIVAFHEKFMKYLIAFYGAVTTYSLLYLLIRII